MPLAADGLPPMENIDPGFAWGGCLFRVKIMVWDYFLPILDLQIQFFGEKMDSVEAEC